MKYNVGDKVLIKSIDWYNENKTSKGCLVCGSSHINPEMICMLGKTVTISSVEENHYRIKEYAWNWTDEMIEGLVEEKSLIKLTGKPIKNDEMVVSFNEYTLPEGYIFKDENGNVINALKIVLEKKKKEYPKTYEECCKVLSIASYYNLKYHTLEHDYHELATSNKLLLLQGKLNILGKLLICRDAYWKIAGKKMGLGKPWELSIGIPIYYIYYNRTLGTIKNDYADDIQGNIILAFPTKEMRDAFYENFEELIETVKELL